MDFSYDPNLVVMSVIVAMMASYAALDLAGRVSASGGRSGGAWLLGGAVAMGTGIWSMHFIGMLAVQMPIALGYDPLLTALSLLIAVLTSGFALSLVGGAVLRPRTLVPGGFIMGIGICGMHYTGMLAMKMSPPVSYDPLLFAASVLIAVGASLAALWLAFRLRSGAGASVLRLRGMAAVVMGLAISGMHYTGMEAARFAPGSICTAAIQLGGDSAYLGHGIGIAILLVLALTLLASLFDARLGSRTQRMLEELQESEEKYRSVLETSTDAVLLVGQNGLIRYANPSVRQVFGWLPQEVVGQGLELLQPARLRLRRGGSLVRYLARRLRRQQGRTIELTGLRRDGRELPLELAFSTVSLRGERLYAGFVRDVSERKEREAGIARLSRVQAVLSGIHSLIVRARSRQSLFEEACRIAVEQGGLRMAMIALAEGDAVRPAAVYGFDEGYVAENIRISLSGADPLGRGPTADALREKRVRVCNDIAADPVMAPWREAALRRGYRASATFPLLEGGQLAGCISLYAGEAGFFDSEELRLLAQLADDVSHALEFIARDEQLDYLAYYDSLTRLANRKLFAQRLERFIDLARRERGVVAVVKLGVSGFRAVNDAVGQAGGDQVLRLIADRIVGYAGNPHHVARAYGDRFVIALPQLRRVEDLTPQRLQPLWAALARPFSVAGVELRLSIHAGIALFPADGEEAEGLLRNAEAALKTAQASGEDFVLYTPQMGAAISAKRSLEVQLRQALEREEFVLHYQPKVSLLSNAVCGAEALIRWNSPELGLVPPDRFIPLLEGTGLILGAGRWALRRAAADHRLWTEQGLRPPRLAVNLSPVQLRRPDFADTLRADLTGPDGELAGVDLEITESVMMHDIGRHIDALCAVRDMGVAIAVDDFGTGYSSLAYLNRLPIAAVKIDRSFVVQMSDSADTMNIVSTIVSLAHAMRLKVIAEGVDAPEQLRFLRLLRCDEIQGFLFSRGLPAEDFAALLREGRRLPPG